MQLGSTALKVTLLCLLACGGVFGIVGYDGQDHLYPSQVHRNMRHRGHARMLNRLAAPGQGARTGGVGATEDEALKVMHNVAKRHNDEVEHVSVSGEDLRGETPEKVVDDLQRMVRRVLRAEESVKDRTAVKDIMHRLDEVAHFLVQSKAPPEMMGAINAMRAEMCAERGFDDDSYDDCVKFMTKACDPGSDGLMDGDKGEFTTGKGYCKKFFPEEAPAPAPAPAKEEAKAAPAPAPAKEEEPKEAAPAPAPAKEEVKEEPAGGPVEADKKEKDLPEQGFEGPLVQHDDKKTTTSDWRKEFGPKGPKDNYKSICSEHPDNEWCIRNGHLSGAPARMSSLLLPAAVLVLGILRCA